MEKKCKTKGCNNDKPQPSGNFYKSSTTSDKLSSRCKKCLHEYNKERNKIKDENLFGVII